MQFKTIIQIFCLFSLIMVVPAQTLASDCYADPIYERAWHGKYKQAAFVRDRACTTGTTVIETVPGGTVVEIVAETDGWYQVKTPKRQTGWTGTTLISITNEAVTSTTPTPTPTPTTTPTAPTTGKLIVDTYSDTSFTGRVRGKLLLQVEDKGRIWYVNPVSNKRYEVTRENAMDLFRNHALGITNSELYKIPSTTQDSHSYNLDLRQRMRGRVLLQVEAQGQTWYVLPGELRRVQVTSADLYEIFKSYSLGITNADLDRIPRGDITQSTVAGSPTTTTQATNLPNVGISAPIDWQKFTGAGYSLYYPVGWYSGVKSAYPTWVYLSEEQDYIANLNTSNYLSVDSYVVTYKSAGKCVATESDDSCLKKGGYYLTGYAMKSSEKMNINGAVALREWLNAPRGTTVNGSRVTSENESIILYTYRKGADLYRVQYFNAHWQEDYGFDQFDQIAKTFKLSQ